MHTSQCIEFSYQIFVFHQCMARNIILSDCVNYVSSISNTKSEVKHFNQVYFIPDFTWNYILIRKLNIFLHGCIHVETSRPVLLNGHLKS